MTPNDYRSEVWGCEGMTSWKRLLPASGLAGLDARGNWKRDGDSVVGEAGDAAAAIRFGDADWADFEVRVRVIAESGGNVQIPFRISGKKREGYMLDLLLGWQACAISRVGSGGVTKLSVVNHELKHAREYVVEIAARGKSLTSYVDGVLVNQVTDGEFDKGFFELSVWNGRTRFIDPMARRLG